MVAEQDGVDDAEVENDEAGRGEGVVAENADDAGDCALDDVAAGDEVVADGEEPVAG